MVGINGDDDMSSNARNAGFRFFQGEGEMLSVDSDWAGLCDNASIELA